jgi:hypothetical protein
MAKSSKTSKDAKPKAPPKTKEQRTAEKQALALWALLGNGGSGVGSSLKPEIEKAERDALVNAGLVTVKEKSRPIWLDVTDRGWHWAEEHLADSLPDKTFGGAFVLRAWLTRLQAFMKTHDIGLADILVQHSATDHNVPSANAEAYSADDYASIRDQIRRVYLDITGGTFNTRALLRDIRAKLPKVGRAQLDEALKRMQRDEDASLMQLDNRVEITNADRDAALYIGREPRHILWISR